VRQETPGSSLDMPILKFLSYLCGNRSYRTACFLQFSISVSIVRSSFNPCPYFCSWCCLCFFSPLVIPKTKLFYQLFKELAFVLLIICTGFFDQETTWFSCFFLIKKQLDLVVSFSIISPFNYISFVLTLLWVYFTVFLASWIESLVIPLLKVFSFNSQDSKWYKFPSEYYLGNISQIWYPIIQQIFKFLLCTRN